MQSISQLQRKVQALQDELNDIFHATNLNFEALSLQIQNISQNQLALGSLNQCQKDFTYLQTLYKERANLRLQFLITEQIKEQEAKVRRQRLVQYEEKIYDQRRLIADKQTFFQTLLKPKKRRPANVTIQQFQQQRKQQTLNQQRKNLKNLQQQTFQLKKMYQVIKRQNDHLEKLCKEVQKSHWTAEQQQIVQKAIQKNPIIYSNLKNVEPKIVKKQQILEMCRQIQQIEALNKGIITQYTEEKQLHQYLKWEHAKLVQQYKQRDKQRVEGQIRNFKILESQRSSKYQRSCSV